MDLFINHLTDLADQSYTQNRFTFTDFLDLNQSSQLRTSTKLISPNSYTLYGGYSLSERIMARFGDPNQLGYEEDFPISIIHVSPLIHKFSDELTHSDYLGALMNLGIERSLLGDLLIDNREATLFCVNRISSYLLENLTKVKHTHVQCQLLDQVPTIVLPTLTAHEELLPSRRLDVFVAKVTKLSRSRALELFQSKKIFINGQVCENHSYQLADGDYITIRGTGKFIFDGVDHITRKDKLRVSYRHYGN